MDGARILKCSSAVPSIVFASKLTVQSKLTWVMISDSGVEYEDGSLALKRGILAVQVANSYWKDIQRGRTDMIRGKYVASVPYYVARST